MRNKIKQIMNKEEGFTLVELLAVIVILGIIVAIAIPAVGSVISRAESNASDAEEELVVDAARLYFTTEEDVGNSVTVQELIDAGYLETRDSKLNSNATVTLKESNDNSVTYEFSSSGNEN